MSDIFSSFKSYTEEFLHGNDDYDINIILKIEHSMRVAVVAEDIAKREMSFDLSLAYKAALLHDIGRFEQYKTYQSFDDATSTNHGELGYQVLRKHEGLMRLIPDNEKEVLLDCIRYHNVLRVPSEIPESTRRYIHLVRDADKIDIIDLFINLFISDEITECLIHKLPMTEAFTEAIARKLIKGEMILSSELNTSTDFKLKLFSWFNDCVYPSTLQIIKEMGLPEKMNRILPEDPLLAEAYDSVTSRMFLRLKK
jgi:putative nucleotidyltransferase with HDIG domain